MTSNTTTSPTSPTSSDAFTDEAPLLALITQPPHELTLQQVEDQINQLRSVRVNGHVLQQTIAKEGLKRGKKAKPLEPEREPSPDLLEGLL